MRSNSSTFGPVVTQPESIDSNRILFMSSGKIGL
ncbi:uncharacterized protein METZ01_LOCUS341998 [marine metagenome]|uniref:Uncharacterized protein n=1 Tax=marine metagenome TaxID=408172 RepID=A0A382QUG4_9ZZZZ